MKNHLNFLVRTPAPLGPHTSVPARSKLQTGGGECFEESCGLWLHETSKFSIRLVFSEVSNLFTFLKQAKLALVVCGTSRATYLRSGPFEASNRWR